MTNRKIKIFLFNLFIYCLLYGVFVDLIVVLVFCCIFSMTPPGGRLALHVAHVSIPHELDAVPGGEVIKIETTKQPPHQCNNKQKNGSNAQPIRRYDVVVKMSHEVLFDILTIKIG